jgi:hypothetical protein
MGNEEYIFDPRFEVICCSVYDGETTVVHTEREHRRWVEGVDWSNTVIMAHNIKFDCAILAWKYRKIAKLYIDTMGVASQFIRPFTGRADLKVCAEYLRLPPKSGILADVHGMRAIDIQTAGMWDAYTDYCGQDARSCWAIWQRYWPEMSRSDKLRLDWTTRNYLQTSLLLDDQVLAANEATLRFDRDTYLAECGLNDPGLLRSSHKFAALLGEMGIEIEYKSGKVEDIPAVAKNDPFIRRLLLHPDPRVVMLTKARLAFSSTIEVTRTKRMRTMCRVTKGRCLIPYNYHAAHTGRPGGTDGMNLTNLGRDSSLRKAIVAQPGRVLVTADAKQIEARIVATLTRCTPLVEAFRDERDPYAEFMCMVLNETITARTHPTERQCGKVCLLSLQYGVGWSTLQKRLLVDGIIVTEDEAKFYVDGYRSGYPMILGHRRNVYPGSGAEACKALREAIVHQREVPWEWNMLMTPKGIRRPNGSWLFYDQLCVNEGEINYYSHRYKSWQKLYPGSVNENMAQSMAGDHVGEVHCKFLKQTRLHNYDALTLDVPVEEATHWEAELIKALSTPPAWAPELPLAAEGKIGKAFG